MPIPITPRPGSAIWRCTNLNDVERLIVNDHNPFGYVEGGGPDDMSGGDPEAVAAARITISDGTTVIEIENLLSTNPLVILSPTRPPFFTWEQLTHWEVPSDEEVMQAFLDLPE